MSESTLSRVQIWYVSVILRKLYAGKHARTVREDETGGHHLKSTSMTSEFLSHNMVYFRRIDPGTEVTKYELFLKTLNQKSWSRRVKMIWNLKNNSYSGRPVAYLAPQRKSIAHLQFSGSSTLTKHVKRELINFQGRGSQGDLKIFRQAWSWGANTTVH